MITIVFVSLAEWLSYRFDPRISYLQLLCFWLSYSSSSLLKVICFMCLVMIKSISMSISLIILCLFKVSPINCRSLAFEVICRQPSELKKKHAGYAQISKHKKSNIHIFTFKVKLEIFGTSKIDLALNDQQKPNISLHNSKVKENREKFKILIEETCFLADKGSSFGGNCESANSFNRGN